MPHARTASSRRSPIGSALQQVVERHDQALHSLGAELQELQVHSHRAGPTIVEEQQLVRRLRRELGLCRREADIVSRGLETWHQGGRELERCEARCHDESLYSAELEAKAADLLSESPTAQRRLQAEGEVFTLQTQRRDFLAEIRTFKASIVEKHQQISDLDAGAEAWALNSGLPSGASLLRAVGSAYCDAEDIRLSLARLGEEAARIAEEREAILLSLRQAQHEHRTEVAQLAHSETHLLAIRAQQGALTTEVFTSHESLKFLSQQRITLFTERDTLQSELNTYLEELCKLSDTEHELGEELIAAAVLSENMDFALPDFKQRLAELDSEISCESADRQRLEAETWKGNVSQESSGSAIRRRNRELLGELARAKASLGEFEALQQSCETRDNEQLLLFSSEMESSQMLILERRQALRKAEELRERLAGEQAETQVLEERSDRIFRQCEALTAQWRTANQRLEALRAKISSDSVLLESKGNTLRMQLAVRDLSQAKLADEIKESSRELAELKAQRELAGREAAVVGRTNAKLRSLLVVT